MQDENGYPDTELLRVDHACVSRLIPYYVLVQNIHPHQMIIEMKNLDSFVVNFETISKINWILPDEAFDHYLGRKCDKRHTEEVFKLISALPLPVLLTAALTEILTSNNHTYMMNVINLLSKPVFFKVKEDVRLKKHHIFASDIER